MAKIKLTPQGQISSGNLLNAPPGSHYLAQNVDLIQGGVIQQRRELYVGNAGAFGFLGAAFRMLYYKNTVISFAGTKTAHGASASWYHAATAYSGTYNVPTTTGATNVHGAEAGGCFYFTSLLGPYKLDSLTGTPALAGGYFAGALSLSSLVNNATAALNWLGDSCAAAYRTVVGVRDATNRLVLGAPSGRSVVQNASGGARQPKIKVLLPNGVATTNIIQVYRSSKQSTALATEPGDDMRLVLEFNPTAGDIALGYVLIDDVTPDEVQGAELYTNSTQQGIANANEPPPIAACVALFKDTMFYANTIERHTQKLQILSVGAQMGIQVGDKITINGKSYIGAAAEDATTRSFLVSTGLGTISQNITATAQSLCYVINYDWQKGNQTVVASYVSDPSLPPGQLILRQSQGNYATSFAVTASVGTAGSTQKTVNTAGLVRVGSTVTATTTAVHGYTVGMRVYLTGVDTNFPAGPKTIVTTGTTTTFTYTEAGTATSSASAYTSELYRGEALNPVLPITGSTVTSISDARKNRVFFSKPGQFEAVPSGDYFDIGSQDERIMQIVVCGDRLLVWKTDGLYAIVGDNPNFGVRNVDLTVYPLAECSIVKFNNGVVGLTRKGLVYVSNAAPEVISQPLEDKLWAGTIRSGTLDPTLYQNSFCVADEFDGKLYFFPTLLPNPITPITSSHTECQYGYVYHAHAGQWTTFETGGVTAGVYDIYNQQLVLGDAYMGNLLRMRLSYDLSAGRASDASIACDGTVGYLLASSSSSAPYTVTFGTADGNVGTYGMRAGDYLNGTPGAKILSVDSTTQVTVDASMFGADPEATTYVRTKRIRLTLNKQFAGNSSSAKTFQEFIMVGDDQFASPTHLSTIAVSIYSDTNSTPTTFTHTVVSSNVIRIQIPREHSRAAWIVVDLQVDQAVVTGQVFRFLNYDIQVVDSEAKASR